ncbi:hypothetical protein C9374_007917 [Naegleria lovaniensis]|uniref:Uncharacterized protein n=1 Tax=Naegleria lovaniensis TaxID=51637 RepID=A0AA88GJQ2_NAELO|nr:uncharacterized protein C9374_007917 [Naegleria lovaniensis]KAG2378769.1 hypothetical protein C9374_007917 [Naegleria lovaniensis]
MGVKELWKLLRPAAFSVQSLDILSGKRVAVDISVWLHQFMLGMGLEDDDSMFGGSGSAHLHHQTFQVRFLRALFKRICKLLYYNVKPVFVFDGATPLVKQKTLQRRRMKSTKQNFRLKKAAKKLLSRVIQDSVGSSSKKRIENMKKPKMKKSEESDEEEPASFNFALPSESTVPVKTEKTEDTQSLLCDVRNYEINTDEEEFEEIPPASNDHETSFAIDIDLESGIDPDVFKSLPQGMQQEILKQLKASKRHSSLSHIKELKEKTPERFSSTQLHSFIKGSAASIQLQRLMKITENEQLIASLPTNQTGESSAHGTSQHDQIVVKDEPQEEEELGFFPEEENTLSTPRSSSQLNLTPSSTVVRENSREEYRILAGGRLASNPNQGFILMEHTPPKEKQVSPPTNTKRSELSQETITRFSNFLSRTEKPIQETATEPSQPIRDNTTIHIVDDEDNNCENNASADENIEITFTLNGITEDDMLPDSIFSTSVEQDNSDENENLSAAIRNMNEELRAFEKTTSSVNNTSSFSNQEEDDEFEEVKNEMVLDEEWEDVQQTNRARQQIVEIIEDDDEIHEFDNEKTKKRPFPAMEQDDIYEEHNDDDDVISIHSIENNDESSNVSTPITASQSTVTTKDAVFEDSFERSFEDEQSSLLQLNVPMISQEEVSLQDLNAARFEQNLFDSDYPMIDLSNANSKTANLFLSLVELAKELLAHFGIPYVMSPSEADAQCGFLCQNGLVDAVITEDSDLFLFGANCVYRNVFGSSNKNINKNTIEEYKMENIEKELGFKRTHLIQLALLLGSDYTDGVHNVGKVTATQVLDAFNPESFEDSDLDDIDQIVYGLKEFKAWVADDTYNIGQTEKSWGHKGDFQYNYRGSKKKFIFPDTFPDTKIIDAYIKPTVDNSLTEFEWADIDDPPSSSDSSKSASSSKKSGNSVAAASSSKQQVDSSVGSSSHVKLNWDAFYRFCAERMNMDQEEADRHLKPVLAERKKRQALKNKKVEEMTPLERFIYEAEKKKKKAASIESKRVLNAVGSIKNKQQKKKQKKK